MQSCIRVPLSTFDVHPFSSVWVQEHNLRSHVTKVSTLDKDCGWLRHAFAEFLVKCLLLSRPAVANCAWYTDECSQPEAAAMSVPKLTELFESFWHMFFLTISRHWSIHMGKPKKSESEDKESRAFWSSLPLWFTLGSTFHSCLVDWLALQRLYVGFPCKNPPISIVR